MKTVWRKEGGVFPCLRPADPEAENALAKISIGEQCMVEIKRPRNVAQHNKYMAMLRLVLDATDVYDSVEELRDAILIAVGRYHMRKVLWKGELVEQPWPDSISFESMDQTEFNRLWDDTVKLLVQKFLPHLTDKNLEAELLEFMS